MLRLLADENFNSAVVYGVRMRNPELDILRAQDVGLAGLADPMLLEWAAGQDHILLTHDVSTMTRYAYDHVRAGLPMPGVFEVRPGVALGQVIEDLLILAAASLEGEWEGQIRYLPL